MMKGATRVCCSWFALVLVVTAVANLDTARGGPPRANEAGGQLQNDVPALRSPESAAISSEKSTVTFVVDITEQNYEKEVAKSPQLVLIHFWAPWAGPCRQLSPRLQAIAKEYQGKVKVGKVDVDENVKLTDRFQVKRIPTLILMKNGAEQERVVGLKSEKELGQMLEKHLKKSR